MSRVLGKGLAEAEGLVGVDASSSVSIKYVKSTDSYMFSGSEGTWLSFSVSASVVEKMIEADLGSWQYEWSVGYKTRTVIRDIRALREAEMNWICGEGTSGSGRKHLLSEGLINSDSDFDDLSKIQYFFFLSNSVLSSAKKQWKRKRWGRSDTPWIELKKRDFSVYGRKLGSKNKEKVSGSGSDSDSSLELIEHNKKAALSRGFVSWWIDACKEECELLGTKFDKELCLKQWKEQNEKR